MGRFPVHGYSYLFGESDADSNTAGVAVLYFRGSAPAGLPTRSGGQAGRYGAGTKRAVGAWIRGVSNMGEQVRELFDWARRRKILAAVFVALTLVVGILIGSGVSGRVSAVEYLGFSGTTAAAPSVPHPVPSSSSVPSIVTR